MIQATWQAIKGLFYAVPFFAANYIISERVEPMYSMLRPEGTVTLYEQVMLAMMVALMFRGALTAFYPLRWRDENGQRHFYFLNIIVSIGLFVVFAYIAYQFGMEIYQCEVLKVANCD